MKKYISIIIYLIIISGCGEEYSHDNPFDPTNPVTQGEPPNKAVILDGNL